MRTIKFFTLTFALFLCSTAFAQFANTNSNTRNNRGTTSKADFGPVSYKGFVEGGYALGVGDFDFDRIDVSTSHGIQISRVFLGLGVGIKYFHDEEVLVIPIVADFRVNFLNNDVTPFIGTKIGCSAGKSGGFTLTPAIGCRFKIQDNFGLNLSLGYDLQKSKVHLYYYSGSHLYHTKVTENLGAIVFKIGFEF